MAIARDLIDDGNVERPWLGIVPEELAPNVARRMLGRDAGVYVAEVFRDTPAYKGGLYRGDIILKINDTPVTSILELQRAVFSQVIGAAMKVTVLRSNRELEVTISSERMPSPGAYAH
jgi:S1-C subfamily serine protease